MEAELIDFLHRYDMPVPDELKQKNHLSILIVDDEEPFLRSFKRWFEKYTDYNIIVTSNGMESLLIAAEEKPDLIVLDIMLPGMNGVELCRVLKTRPSTKNIQVIGISGKADKKTRDDMVGAGAHCCIDKTEALPDIAQRIDKYLGNIS
jgi:CheY-like chemotaxis protein